MLFFTFSIVITLLCPIPIKLRGQLQASRTGIFDVCVVLQRIWRQPSAIRMQERKNVTTEFSTMFLACFVRILEYGLNSLFLPIFLRALSDGVHFRPI